MVTSRLITALRFLIVRTDSLGNIRWQYSSVVPEPTNPISSKMGEPFRRRRIYSNSRAGISGYHASHEAWLLVVDENGNPLWNRCYGGSSGEYLLDGLVFAGRQPAIGRI